MFTEVDYLCTRAFHPRRPPDWRWRLATMVREAAPHRAFRGNENADLAVISARTIQEHYQHKQSSIDLADNLRDRGRAYYDAYTFWHTASLQIDLDAASVSDIKPDFRPISTAAITKAALEGLILADKSPAKIASVVSLTPAAIEVYESLFFDVRSRLRSPLWIVDSAIGSLHQTGPLTMIPALIKAFGYYTRRGEIVMHLATTFDGAMTRRNARKLTLDDFFKGDARGTQATRSALVARMMPYNRYTYEKIIEMHHSAVELEAKLKSGQGSVTEEQYFNAINELRGKIDWQYGEAPTSHAAERIKAALNSGPRLLESTAEIG